MAHVQIRSGKGVEGSAQLIVDGVDMSMQVLAKGLKVNLPTEIGEQATVTMIVACDVLEVDLNDATLEALREEVEPSPFVGQFAAFRGQMTALNADLDRIADTVTRLNNKGAA